MEPDMLRHLSHMLVRELGVMDQWVSGTRLSPLQAQCLIELVEQPLTGLALSTVLKIDKSSVSRILQNLKRQSLIKVLPNPNDGRSILNQITEKGRLQLVDINDKANAYSANVLKQLDGHEYDLLIHSMKKYVSAMRSVAKQANNTITIRHIEAQDNNAIAEIILSVFSEYGLLDREGFSFSDPSLYRLSDVYCQKGSGYWVVELDGTISGGVGIAPLKDGFCELQKLYFLPSVRGMGLARRMIIGALEFARKENYRFCYLESTAALKESLKLYQSLGFEFVTERIGDSGHHACEVLMLKDLQR